jgi:hypothetical protein
MNLLQIAGGRRGQRYRVMVLCDDDDGPTPEMRSQVLELISEVELERPDLAASMDQLMREALPVNGPDFTTDEYFKRLYGDVIYEMKAHEYLADGGYFGLRVAFFRDGISSLFVCTNAFVKAGGNPTPPAEVSLARAQERAYRKAKRRGHLRIERVEEDL